MANEYLNDSFYGETPAQPELYLNHYSQPGIRLKGYLKIYSPLEIRALARSIVFGPTPLMSASLPIKDSTD